MHTMAAEDTEITLGVGKLLGLFFLLAAICGIFFSIGYSLGKSSGREQALNDQPAAAVSADSTANTSNGGDNKPSAAVATKSDAQAPAAQDNQNTEQQGSLTFYNAVKQNDTAPQTAGAESKTAKSVSAVRRSQSGSLTGSRDTIRAGASNISRRVEGRRRDRSHVSGDRTGHDRRADCSGIAGG